MCPDKTTATEYQRRHFGVMEMLRRSDMFTSHPKGRIAVALAVAWKYRHRAMSPVTPEADRRYWLDFARSAVTRARTDRTKTQPALARMLKAANDCAETTNTLVETMRSDERVRA